MLDQPCVVPHDVAIGSGGIAVPKVVVVRCLMRQWCTNRCDRVLHWEAVSHRNGYGDGMPDCSMACMPHA